MGENHDKVNPEISFFDLIIKMKELVRHLLRKWKLIFIIAVSGCILGIAVARIATPKYEATVTFSTMEEKTSPGNIMGLAAQFGISLGSTGNVFNGENLLALIQSKRILTRSLLKIDTIGGKQTNLLNYYMQIEGDKIYKNIHVSFPLALQLQGFNRLQDSVLSDICKNLQTSIKAEKLDKDLDIYELTCITEDEDFTQHLAEELIKQVASFYIETKTKQSLVTVNALQKRADSILQAYNSALSDRALLSDENINPALQQSTVDIERRQTDITVLATAYTEIIKNLELAKFNLLQNTPLVQVIDEPVLPLQKVKKSKMLYGITFGLVFFFLASITIASKYYFNKELQQRQKE